MAICFVEFWIQYCVFFLAKKSQWVYFWVQIAAYTRNGRDGLTDGSIAAMTPWRPPRDLQLKKTWLRNLYKWISVPKGKEGAAACAALELFWEREAWPVQIQKESHLKQQSMPHCRCCCCSRHASKQADRQARQTQKGRKKGEPAWEHANNNSSGD